MLQTIEMKKKDFLNGGNPGLYKLLWHIMLDSYSLNKELPHQSATPVCIEQQWQIGTEGHMYSVVMR
jgi:hypothetical protein